MNKSTAKKPTRLRDSIHRLAMPALSLALTGTAIVLSASEGGAVAPTDITAAAEASQRSLLSLASDWPW